MTGGHFDLKKKIYKHSTNTFISFVNFDVGWCGWRFTCHVDCKELRQVHIIRRHFLLFSWCLSSVRINSKFVKTWPDIGFSREAHGILLQEGYKFPQINHHLNIVTSSDLLLINVIFVLSNLEAVTVLSSVFENRYCAISTMYLLRSSGNGWRLSITNWSELKL